MSKVERAMRGPALDDGVIVPKKGLVELKRLLDGQKGTCHIAYEKPYLYVRAEETTFTVKMIEAEFPPYEQVLNLDNDKQVTVVRRDLIQALRRAQLVTGETGSVKVTASEGQLMIWSGDGKDDAYETVEVEYDGEKVIFSMNPEYICDILSRMEEEKSVIEISNGLAPILFREKSSPHYVGVIMPMRI
jgi:DNA polymerase-3 subunit beta